MESHRITYWYETLKTSFVIFFCIVIFSLAFAHCRAVIAAQPPWTACSSYLPCNCATSIWGAHSCRLLLDSWMLLTLRDRTGYPSTRLSLII